MVYQNRYDVNILFLRFFNENEDVNGFYVNNGTNRGRPMGLQHEK